MGDEQGYNGWSNYETWATALWIDNNQVTYTHARELAKGGGLRPKAHLAEQLQVWIEDEREAWEGDRSASLYTDLLGAAMSEIDWREIAEAILSETEGES